MRAGLTPNAVQWCRCGGLGGPNLAESVAVRRRFRAGVGVFWQTHATFKGFEVMRALRKGQAEMFALQGGVVGEARIVERAFGVGPCVLTEAMAWLQNRLASAET